MSKIQDTATVAKDYIVYLERQLAEAREKLRAVRELHAFGCTIDQACLVSLDDIDVILGEKGA